MGHLSGDAGPLPAGIGMVGGGSPEAAPRRAVEAVRRGAVRERVARPEVPAPSTWEHVEVELGDAADTLSTLALDLGGTFRASIQQRQHGEETGVISVASGSWRRCRGGVELTFEEEPELGLADYMVFYRLARGSLVADEVQLPDGLAHQYSPCVAVASEPRPRSAKGAPSPMLARMIADSSTAASPKPEEPEVAGKEEAASPRGPQPLGLIEERGQLPVGLIEEGSDAESDEDVAFGGDAPSGAQALAQALSAVTALTAAATGMLASAAAGAPGAGAAARAELASSVPAPRPSEKPERAEEHSEEEDAAGEEYADDFEGSSSEEESDVDS